MFGRRSGGPVPKATRFVIGAIATLVGGLAAWLGVRAANGAVPEAEGSAWIAVVFGAAMAGMGLMLLIGAFAGVGDRGERPASMPLGVRLLLDTLGHMWVIGFAAMMLYFAVLSSGDSIPAAILFGFFALLFGGLSLYTLARALIRALRGEPYDDGAPTA